MGQPRLVLSPTGPEAFPRGHHEQAGAHETVHTPLGKHSVHCTARWKKANHLQTLQQEAGGLYGAFKLQTVCKHFVISLGSHPTTI
jgi:hypothetical protein